MTPLEEVVKRLAGGASIVRCAGLAGSSRSFFLSRLLEKEAKKVFVYLAPTSKEAQQIQSDLEFFGKKAELFPAHDALPFSGLSPHLDISCQRMSVLGQLATGQCRIVVTTPTALFALLPPPSLLQSSIILVRGEERDRHPLIEQLAAWGYEKMTLVTDRGTFAVRGSLIDIFPPTGELPLRFEWVGDQIESIRSFEIRSQKSRESLEMVSLIPARQVVLEEEQIQTFRQKVRHRAEERDIPKSVWGPLLEKVKEGIFFSGIETYLPLFYESPATLWDYLSQPVVILDNPPEIKERIQDHLRDVEVVAEGRPTLILPSEYRSSIGVWPDASTAQRIELSPMIDPETITFQTETQEGIRHEIKRNSLEPLAPVAKKIRSWLDSDRVILVAHTTTQAGRLRDLLDRYFSPSFPFEITVGSLSSGFRFPEEKITYLTDEEIFGPRLRRPKRPTPGETPLSSLAEVKVGSPLVHRQHGIGLYRGLVHMKIEGVANDFLLIEYRGEDKLYLPIYRMNLVQKYTGGEDSARLDRLGGTTWMRSMKKAQKAIREMAGDLLNLYAARSAGKGFPFSPPSEMFEAFEAGFSFEETPDQERAIADTLADMEKQAPMDRLILGDVGYGKTEVAMRAAFKACLDGKQTAVLVPTTLLAFQHGERFGERFSEMPVRIGILSRFRTRTEQKQILKELAEGKIDIIIGTHRLLQPDVSFKDLALLVVDEEHRFGVAHKERVKQLRKNIDVLTLSATPIPRTLHMSLVGLRGVSVIETPPTDRLAIRTFVMPFQDSVIREAILREIKRGGQVFFLHNNVQTIDRMRKYLRKLIPEASCEIAHGQMNENDLEEIMIRFYRREFNLLLCTTIIESGIDIPTANTILINDAHRFGLAQIYQLRGRVGRASHRAFAYLLVPEEKKLTPEAVKRLQILQKFSDLGSGFRMANYDLEIRGAGNLLGREQSGQITAIGFELYQELLGDAIRELKGEEVLQEIDPELHFKIPAFLPESYVPDPPLRLELYRRLASLASEEEIEPILDELRDRFGRLPAEVENLVELSAIKTYAKKLRLKQIRYDGRNFSYAFDPSSPLDPALLTKMIKKDPKHLRLTPDMRLIIQKPLKLELVLMETKRFLRGLAVHL